MRAIITGHGQGNYQDCAEFCQNKHGNKVGTRRHERTIWRGDCASNPVQPQYGTWQYPRAGWCPGADVKPWVMDVTGEIQAGGEQTIVYDVEKYENTCRPDAPVCKGCIRNWGNCDYNYDGHTAPSYYMSAALLVYE